LIVRTLDADGSSGTGDIEKSVYAYDGDQIALQFDKTSADGSSGTLNATNLSHRYLWDSQTVDHLFANEDVAEGEVLYALTDHQGTIRDLATYDAQNDSTTIANHRIYDSYGNLESETNSAVDCIFGYTGRLFDSATGLQNNLNRWYDPTTGAWISQDPISFAAGDANLYRYVGNSVLECVDPTGLETQEEIKQRMRDSLEKSIVHMSDKEKTQARQELNLLFATVAAAPTVSGRDKCWKWVDSVYDKLINNIKSPAIKINTQLWKTYILWDICGQSHLAVKVEIGGDVYFIENGEHFLTPKDVPWYHTPTAP
jgi:RHS repeat-associated protein